MHEPNEPREREDDNEESSTTHDTTVTAPNEDAVTRANADILAHNYGWIIEEVVSSMGVGQVKKIWEEAETSLEAQRQLVSCRPNGSFI